MSAKLNLSDHSIEVKLKDSENLGNVRKNTYLVQVISNQNEVETFEFHVFISFDGSIMVAA